jgi:hypothetical protein
MVYVLQDHWLEEADGAVVKFDFLVLPWVGSEESWDGARECWHEIAPSST